MESDNILNFSPLTLELPNTAGIIVSWPSEVESLVALIKQADGTYVETIAKPELISALEDGDYEYLLPYNASDRLSVPGSQRFKFTDGTYTGFLTVNYHQSFSSVLTTAPDDAF